VKEKLCIHLPIDKPIEVEALGLSEQSPAVPLSKVKLT
jgi:hypothetical protein